MMPDRDDVFVGVPCGYGVADSLAYLSLARIAGRGFFDPDHHLYVLHGCSDIQAARFTIMDAFKSRSECNWLLMLDADIGYRPEDVELLFDGDELAVCAEYRKKEENYRVAQFGLGFAIVHRDVFKAMDALETDGQPWVPQGMYAGRLVSGYAPAGFTQAGDYRAEDHGFWGHVHATQLPVRLETRTQLIHTGTYHYRYEPGRPQEAPTRQYMDGGFTDYD
jgi:hypothetical protein